jgi:FeS assembly SUF system protein
LKSRLTFVIDTQVAAPYNTAREEDSDREEPMTTAKPKLEKEQIIAALREVFDPEIPVNVYDLGLVYAIEIDDENQVNVEMTLTAPGCGMGPVIATQAEWRIAEVEGVADVHVEMVFDPPWTPDLVTPDGKKLLGID